MFAVAAAAPAANASVGFTWWMLAAAIGSVIAGVLYVVVKLMDKGARLRQVGYALRREPGEVVNIVIVDVAGGLLVAGLVALTRVSGPLALPQFINNNPFIGWMLIGTLGPILSDHTFVGRLLGVSYGRVKGPAQLRAAQTVGSIARAREASVTRVIERLYAIIVSDETKRIARLLRDIPPVLRSSPIECQKLVLAVDHYFVMTHRQVSQEVKSFMELCKESLEIILPSASDQNEATPEDLFERSYSLARRLLNEGHLQPVEVTITNVEPAIRQAPPSAH